MLLVNFTPDLGALEGHISYPDNGTIRVELKFSKPLLDHISCIFYLEFDISVRIHKSQTVSSDLKYVDSTKIVRTLSYLKLFLSVFLSYLLPRSIARSTTTVIVNVVTHTQIGSLQTQFFECLLH